jgi:uncharacterized protein (TIGR00106 family)
MILRSGIAERRLRDMLASFSVAPVGTGEALGELVADIMTLVEASGLPYKFGAMQTTVEGDQEEVLRLIMSCHRRMLEKAPRVVTHIALDDRKRANGRLEGKVKDVESILGRSLSHE